MFGCVVVCLCVFCDCLSVCVCGCVCVSAFVCWRGVCVVYVGCVPVYKAVLQHVSPVFFCGVCVCYTSLMCLCLVCSSL